MSIKAQFDLDISCQRLGDLLARLGDMDEAAEIYREHLARLEERLGADDPTAELIRTKLKALIKTA